MSRRVQVWTGRTVSALIVLFLLMNGVGDVLQFAPYTEGAVHVGYPASVVFPLGLVLVACTIAYAIPRTSVFGAILLTGYFGGATATHVRIGEPYWIPVLFGVLVWFALFLREPRLRALVPMRRPHDESPERARTSTALAA